MFSGKFHQVTSPDSWWRQILHCWMTLFMDLSWWSLIGSREDAPSWRGSAAGRAKGRPGARAWDSVAGRVRGRLAGTGRGRPLTRGRAKEARGATTIKLFTSYWSDSLNSFCCIIELFQRRNSSESNSFICIPLPLLISKSNAKIKRENKSFFLIRPVYAGLDL